MQKESPAWTMTNRKFYSHHETTPGPGAYSHASTLSGPSFRIGRSTRVGLSSNLENPGPGSYSPQKHVPFLGNTFMPTANRSQINRNYGIPGPGQYASFIKSEGPAYTLRGRRYANIKEKNPGPGCYTPIYNSSLERAPSFALSTAKRDTSLASNRSPGPGNYNFKDTLSGPGWGFGSSVRSVSTDNSIPGPGSYSIKVQDSNASFSMTPRRPIHEKMRMTPGPGAYDYFLKEGSPQFSISKSQRKNLGSETPTPGPGTYSPELPKSNMRNVFGIAKRQPIGNPEVTPGPGNYNPASLDKSPSFSLRSRPTEKNKEKSPGPGRYSPNADFILGNSPAFIVGKSQKKFETEQEKSSKLTPGPGSYDSPITLSGPKWGFGSIPKIQVKPNIPVSVSHS